MKVTNPNPCLVNVYANGKYVAIGPGASAEVNAKAAKALIASGQLIREGDEPDEEEDVDQSTEGDDADQDDDATGDGTGDEAAPAKRTRKRR